MAHPIKTYTVVIANGAAVSSSFECEGYRIVGVISPTDWTTAAISFEVELPDTSAFVKVVDNTGILYKLSGISTGTEEYHLIGGDIAVGQPDVVITANRARLCSSNTGSEADVNQGAERTLYVVLVPCG